MRDGMVEVYRTVVEPGRPLDVAFLVSASSRRRCRRTSCRASADRLAARAVASGHEETQQDELDSGGVAAAIGGADLDADARRRRRRRRVAASARGRPRSRRCARPRPTRAIRGCASCKGPIQGIYQSVFLAVSLLILISATWLGLYLAKRITRPVQMLAEGARAIGAGQLDLRLEPETGDELGSLVESFNMMAAELRTSREKLEQSRQRSRAEEPRGRRAAPLHRDDPRARRDRRHLARRRRAHLDGQRRRRAAARARRARHRPAGR